MRADYRTERFAKVSVRGIICGYTDMRIDRDTIPAGKYQYEIAGDDDCGDDPVRVQHGILVSFFGTLICDEPLPLGEGGILWLADGDFKWL